MPLYLKVLRFHLTRLILGIFSLTVPEGARSQSPTNEGASRRYRRGETQGCSMERPEPKENGHDLSDHLNPQCGALVEGFDHINDRDKCPVSISTADLLGATRPR